MRHILVEFRFWKIPKTQMENPRKFKIIYNKHEHKYFNYQIKKKNQKTLSCNIILLTFTTSLFCCHCTLLLLIFFYCIWNYAVFPDQKKQLINLHNIYIRVHVGNVGIYFLTITSKLKPFKSKNLIVHI